MSAPLPNFKRCSWKLSTREKRLLIYLAVLLVIAAWRFVPRPWNATLTVETSHFIIASTATREQTERLGRLVEVLYATYSNRFSTLPTFQLGHPKLKLMLYKDRAEMRRVHPGLGWAEAFYRKPACHAYYSAAEVNPHHWMLHEVVHQLNEEVAYLKLKKWLEEGLAAYFSTSQINADQLRLGRIDFNTYPVWWLDDLATTANLRTNIQNGSIIPLRSIITGHGGLGLNRQFNLYYLHWWTLAHFVFERNAQRGSALQLLQEGGGLNYFERVIGPLEEIEPDWHAHVLKIKTSGVVTSRRAAASGLRDGSGFHRLRIAARADPR